MMEGIERPNLLDSIKTVLMLSGQLFKFYAFGLGIMVGLLVYHYGLYLLFASTYECTCEAVNLAVWMKENINENCLKYAQNNYQPINITNLEIKEDGIMVLRFNESENNITYIRDV